jgi:hypothetical protein
LHCREKELFIGITIGRVIEQGGADRRDFTCYVGGIRAGLLKLILEQEAFELVVVDTDGNDDRAEGVIASGKTAAHLLGGAIEAANGEKSVDAGAD